MNYVWECATCTLHMHTICAMYVYIHCTLFKEGLTFGLFTNSLLYSLSPDLYVPWNCE